MDTHVHSTSPPTLLPQERLDHLSRSPLPLQNSSIVHGASGALPQASSFPSSFSSYYPHSSFPSSSFPSSSCPPAPASPSPLTLRDFLQLLGESVAVLEGLRLLLLQLLQWGGEVGSVVRASTFLHKLLAFLFRVLRLLLSPLSAAFHLLASPRHAKREEGDGRNRERIPPPLGNRGPRSLGAVDRGTLADAEPYSASLVNTFHNAWRSAREGAQTAGGTYPISLGWSAPGFAEDKALRVAPHLHGKPGSHLQASASKPIPEKGLLSRLRGQTSWAALARVWRGRRGVVIYAAIVFGLACKLRSLWKKYRKLLVQYRIAARILARRLEEREERERRQAALEEEASKQAAAEEQQSRQEMLYSLFQSLRKQRNEQLLASRSASQEAASFRVTSPSATADPASPRSSSALCAAGSASSSFASSSTMSTTPGAVEEGESGRPLKAHDADQERRVPDEKLSWSTCKPHHAADQFSSAENKHKLWTGIDLGETSLALSCLPERRSSTTTGSNGEEEKEEEEEERDGGEEEEGDEKEELEEKGGKEETGGSRLHILACDELDALHLGQTKLTTRLAFQGETRDAQAGASEDFPLKTVRAESKECTSSDARGDADFRLPRSPVRHRRSEITVATSGSVFTHVTTCASSSNPPSVPVPLCEETPSTCLPHRPAASSPPLPSSFSAVSSCSSSSASSSASPSPSASSLFPSLSSSASSSSSFASSSSPSKWLLPAALQSSPENAPPENLPGGAAKRVFESKSEASGVRTRPFGAREKRTTPAFDVNPFLGLLSNSDPGVTPAMQEEREDAFASSHPLMNRAIQQTSQTRDSAGHDQPGDESEGFSKSSVPALSHHVQHSLPLPQKSPHALTSPSSFAPSSSSSSYPASSSTSFLPLTLPHTPLPSVLPLAAFLPPSFPGQPCPSARPGADSVLGEHQRNGDTLPRLIFGETPGSPGRSLPEKLATSDRSLERYTVPAAQRRKLQKGDGEGKGAFDAERCDPRAEGASLRRQETVRKSCRKRGENRIENVDPSASAGRPRRHEEQRNRRLYQTGKCENPDLRARAKAIWLSQQEDLKTILGVHSPRQGSRDFRRVR